jgi:hypothetical protein
MLGMLRDEAKVIVSCYTGLSDDATSQLDIVTPCVGDGAQGSGLHTGSKVRPKAPGEHSGALDILGFHQIPRQYQKK